MQPLADFLAQHRFSSEFRDWYFLPMLGCIWSCPTDQMLQFPVATMIRFCHNHGLMQVSNRPQWWTVQGGARNYVEKITAAIADKRLNTPVRRIERDPGIAENGVRVITDGRTEHFRQGGPGHPLRPVARPAAGALRATSARRWAPSATSRTAPCCTPTPRCCRTRRKAWAAWNYERAASDATEASRVCLHYLINRLQPLPFEQAGGGVAEPGPRDRPRRRSSASSTTTTRCSTWPPSAPRSTCPRCRASTTPISRAPGRATASTKTASRPGWVPRGSSCRMPDKPAPLRAARARAPEPELEAA